MKCSRCSAEIPLQSQFCLRCGTAISNTAANPSGYIPQISMSAPTSNRNMIIVIGVLCALLLGLGGYVVMGMQKASSNKNAGMVQSPGTGGAPGLVQAPAQSAPSGMMQAPADIPPAKIVQEPSAPSPTEIIDYLQFLKQIETSKQALIRRELGDALGMMAKAQISRATVEEDEHAQHERP